ncbi:MAG: M48 family metallopeptidase [Candidatus Pacebacteria bacterium]|nr:M48 family metallopeptidase [Candidatus Paceibacterota bacterium]
MLDITYTLRRRRIRSMNITVRQNGEVIVSASPLVPKMLIERFVAKKSSWIREKQEYFAAHPVGAYSLLLHKRDRREFKALKEKALGILTERLEHFNKIYRFKYGRISIRDQHSRWGSCSAKGNINFNYKLILLPDELRDYVVVHELCHLGELNHSRKFWALVEQTIPGYKKVQKRLRGLD